MDKVATRVMCEGYRRNRRLYVSKEGESGLSSGLSLGNTIHCDFHSKLQVIREHDLSSNEDDHRLDTYVYVVVI